MRRRAVVVLELALLAALLAWLATTLADSGDKDAAAKLATLGQRVVQAVCGVDPLQPVVEQRLEAVEGKRTDADGGGRHGQVDPHRGGIGAQSASTDSTKQCSDAVSKLLA